jgi:hypothetical protein
MVSFFASFDGVSAAKAGAQKVLTSVSAINVFFMVYSLLLIMVASYWLALALYL